MDAQIFSQEFWYSLRSRTSVRGIGSNQCYDWCYETIDLLLKDDRKGQFVMKDSLRSFEFARKGLWWCHGWIETETLKGRFIADGTAGQIDKKYADGFYGLLDQAPPELRAVYDNGILTC